MGQGQGQDADGRRHALTLTMTDDDGPAETRVTVVYCGGCNPHIDRAAVAAGLPVDDPDVRPGTTVHLSGCPRACASDHQLVAEGDERCTSEHRSMSPLPRCTGRPEWARSAPPPAMKDHPSSWWRASWSTACPRRRRSFAPAVTRKLKE